MSLSKDKINAALILGRRIEKVRGARAKYDTEQQYETHFVTEKERDIWKPLGCHSVVDDEPIENKLFCRDQCRLSSTVVESAVDEMMRQARQIEVATAEWHCHTGQRPDRLTV